MGDDPSRADGLPPKREPNYNLLVPFVYAAATPLLRVGLRGKVPDAQLNKIFAGCISVAFVHAGKKHTHTQ